MNMTLPTVDEYKRMSTGDRRIFLDQHCNDVVDLDEKFVLEAIECENDPMAKWYLIKGLGLLGSVAGIPAIIRACKGPETSFGHTTLHLICARSLGQIGSRAISAVLPLLDNPEKEIRRTAVDALGEIGDKSMRDLLCDKFTHDDNEIRNWAALSLAKLGETSIPFLRGFALRNDDLAGSIYAIDAIIKIGGKRALDVISEVLSSGNTTNIRFLLENIEKWYDPQIKKQLIMLSATSDEEIKGLVDVFFEGKVQSSESNQIKEPVLNSDSVEIRRPQSIDNKKMSRDIHNEFESEIRAGSFHPTTLLMYLDFPADQFAWDTSVEIERTLYHEYMHFMQCTSTPFGFNTFLRELEIILLTINTAKELISETSELILPFSQSQKITKNKKTAVILENYFKARYLIEQDLAVAQGFWEFGQARGFLKFGTDIMYKQRPVQCEGGCRCLTFPNDPTMPSYVPIGARAIMEGAASITEFHCLKLIDDQEEMSEWGGRKETDPTYGVALDLASKYLDPSENVGFGRQLALMDLALCMDFEYTFQLKKSDIQYPAARFHQALQAVQKSDHLDQLYFHEHYSDFVTGLCRRLGWLCPWELPFNELRRFIDDNLVRYGPYRFNLLGPSLLFLNGFTFRERYPSYCALPLPDFQLPNKKRRGNIIDMSMVYKAHTPPLQTFQDGTKGFSDLSRKTFEHQIVLDEVVIKSIENSFNELYFLYGLTGLVAYGKKRPDSQRCHYFNLSREHLMCGGDMIAYKSDCYCRQQFTRFIGVNPDNVNWLSE